MPPRKAPARSKKSVTPKSTRSTVASTPPAVSVTENSCHEFTEEEIISFEEPLQSFPLVSADVNSVGIDSTSASALDDKLFQELNGETEFASQDVSMELNVEERLVKNEDLHTDVVMVDTVNAIVDSGFEVEDWAKLEEGVEVQSVVENNGGLNKEGMDLPDKGESVDVGGNATEMQQDGDGLVGCDQPESEHIQEVDPVEEEIAVEANSKTHCANAIALVLQEATDGEEENELESDGEEEGKELECDGEEDGKELECDGEKKGKELECDGEDEGKELESDGEDEGKEPEDGDGEDEGKELEDGDGDNDNGSEGDNEDNEDDEDPSVFVQDLAADKKKDKNLEIYVGRLDKGTVEADLIEVFRKFGELKSVRIVRNQATKKSKGFAFIRFVSVDQAKNALSELKDGVEVSGKHVKISASQDNDTLYVGNICKTWKKDDVLQALKDYGVENIEDIHVPDDPKNDKKIKGFALLEFSTHSEAMEGFKRLKKPDAIFGRDKSARVAFTQTPMHPSEEVLSQVKRVYIEGLCKDWNEEKLKEICKQYGEIVQVNLCQSSRNQRKGFGFITFTSRESALACVQGINDSDIGEGALKVKASIAKPHYKGRLQTQGFRGGFKVEKQNQVTPLKKEGETAKEAESSKVQVNSNSKFSKKKVKPSSGKNKTNLSKSTSVEHAIPKRTQSGVEVQNVGATSKSEKTNRKRKKPMKVKGRRDEGARQAQSERPSKKPKGNMGGAQRDTSRNPKQSRIRKGQGSTRNSSNYRRTPYAPGYDTYRPARAHTSSIPVSERHAADMEPHAGYIAPVSGKQGRPNSGYNRHVVQPQGEPHVVYLEPPVGIQRQLQPRYIGPTIMTHSHGRYVHTAVGTQVQPYGAYVQPAHVPLRRDPYNSGLTRAGGHDGRVGNGSTYVGGSTPSASYNPSYTRYAGHQGGSSYYQSSGGHPPPRTYY